MNVKNLISDTGKESWGSLILAGFLAQDLGEKTGYELYAYLTVILLLAVLATVARLMNKYWKFKYKEQESGET